MDKVYVGLDLGSSSFQQAAINRDGAVTMNRRFPTSEANLRTAFAGLRGEIHVHLEAGELAPWAAAIIAPLVAGGVLAPEGQRVDRQRRRQVRSRRCLQA